MFVKEIVNLLPEVDSVVEKIGSSEDFKPDLYMIYEKTKKLFGDIPEELKLLTDEIVNNSNYSVARTYRNSIFSFIINKTFEHLKSLYINVDRYCAELTYSEIKSFLNIIDKIGIDLTSRALFYIFLSETCRTSDPMASSQLMIDAFRSKPDLTGSIFSTHLKDFKFKPEVVNHQKEIETCIICRGGGTPFHNAPCYRMANYSDDFLPFKLWNKCNNCGNLFSKYFPLKFFDREKNVKTITPTQYMDCDLNKVRIDVIGSWCEILKNLENIAHGKNVLEIGVGNGELVAVALELNYDIDCVEIEEGVAQQISNLLNRPIVCCDFLDFPEEKRYDIITMGDVIEHLVDPRKGLEKVRRLLKNNGVLWISTPNYESAFNRLQKTATAMWNEPWHVTYFSKSGLENLLSEVGFKIIDYKISTHYNGSMEVIAIKK